MKALFFLIITIIFTVAHAQRGGGSRSTSHSSSSYRRSSYSSYGRSTNYGPSTPWTATDFYIFGGIVAAVGGIVAFACIQQQKSQKERNQKLEKIKMDYEGRAQGNMCILEPNKQQEVIDWFMNTKWTLQYFLSNGTSQLMQFKVTDLYKKNNFLYQIKVIGNDPVGSSVLKGFLSLQGDYIGLFFQKSYNNKQAAGQTGNFTILIYEGVQQGERFAGNWFYDGYKNSNENSGRWIMFHE